MKRIFFGIILSTTAIVNASVGNSKEDGSQTLEDLTYPITSCLLQTINKLKRNDIVKGWGSNALEEVQSRYWQTSLSKCKNKFDYANKYFVKVSNKPKQQIGFMKGVYDGSRGFVYSYVERNVNPGTIRKKPIKLGFFIMPDSQVIEFSTYDKGYTGTGGFRGTRYNWVFRIGNASTNICDDINYRLILKGCEK